MSDGVKSEISSDIDQNYSLNTADPKNVQELTIYVSIDCTDNMVFCGFLTEFHWIQVQTLLQNVQDKFQSMSDQVISRIDDMSNRIDDLEKSIGDLMTQAGVEAPIGKEP